MDPKLKAALEFSDYRQTLNQQRIQINDKLISDITFGHNGGMFKITPALINFLELLISKDRKKNVPILDINDNPIMIADLEEFRDDIFDRYLTAVNVYYIEYENLKKSRTVKKLLDL
jgi:hypothetical protein